MDKNIKPTLFVIIAVALIITGAYLGGVFSVIDSSRKDFRQELSCGRSSVFEFDTFKIEYTTMAVSSSIIDPDSDYVNECVPIYVKVSEDNVVLVEYNRAEGLIIDKATSSSNYGLRLSDSTSLDDRSVYIISNSYIDDFSMIAYTPVDTTMASPWKSVSHYENSESFDYSGGLYSFDIDNNGWDSSDRTTGSQLYFKVNPKYGPIDSNVSIIDGQAVLEVVSGFPTELSYTDVCMNFGVVGFAGGVQYDTVCSGEIGIISAKETVTFTFDIPSTNETEYYLRGDIMGMQMILNTITTSGVESRDIQRYLINGDRIEVGNLIGDEKKIITEQAPVEEEPKPVEEPVEEPVDEKVGPFAFLTGIHWYIYAILGFAVLFVVFLIARSKK